LSTGEHSALMAALEKLEGSFGQRVYSIAR